MLARFTCLGRKQTARAVHETPRDCVYTCWTRRVAAIDHIKHNPTVNPTQTHKVGRLKEAQKESMQKQNFYR